MITIKSRVHKFSREISSRICAIKEFVAESSSRSKQYMPRKFAEMSSKFRFGQEFVEKPEISPNFVDRCLHYFCTMFIKCSIMAIVKMYVLLYKTMCKS